VPSVIFIAAKLKLFSRMPASPENEKGRMDKRRSPARLTLRENDSSV
jgi:hypothetical protein